MKRYFYDVKKESWLVIQRKNVTVKLPKKTKKAGK